MSWKKLVTVVIIPICLLIVSFILSSHINFFERLFEFSRTHEEYQLDEIFTASLILIFYLVAIIAGQRTSLKKQNRIINKTLAEKNLLMHESHHRQKNNIYILLSLLRIDKDKFDTPATQDIYSKLIIRLQSMSILYEQMQLSTDNIKIVAKAYFTSFFRHLEEMYHNDNISLTYEIQDLMMHQKTVSLLSLITNELYANSVKYAFPANADSNYRINFSLMKTGSKFEVAYRDNGIGFDPTVEHDGFGNKLVKSLAKQMDAVLDVVNSNGMQYKLCFRDL